ncbi:MAG: hypothetical protein ACREPR_12845 [Brasilonema sp.]
MNGSRSRLLRITARWVAISRRQDSEGIALKIIEKSGLKAQTPYFIFGISCQCVSPSGVKPETFEQMVGVVRLHNQNKQKPGTNNHESISVR